MASNSLPRRIAKRALAPLLNERAYQLIQAVTMSHDIRRGMLSEPEIELIRYAVREGETAIDIGANYGLYAYHLSKAVGPTGRVYAFEPIDFTVGALRIVSRLLRLKNVEIIEKGCGSEPGRVTFRVPVQESGAIIAGTVHMSARQNDRNGRDQHARFTKSRDVACEVVVVDEFLASIDNVSFIKCDIEGADLFALLSARRIIEKHRPIVVCEINPWFLEGFGLKVADIVGFFSELGYQLHRYEDGVLRAKSADEVVEDNWVFIPDERRHRVRSLFL